MELHRSAARHGVSPDEVLHAVEHALVIADMDSDADAAEGLGDRTAPRWPAP